MDDAAAGMYELAAGSVVYGAKHGEAALEQWLHELTENRMGMLQYYGDLTSEVRNANQN